MVDIIVTRGAGDKEAETLVAPFASTTNAAISLGRNKLEETAQNNKELSLTIPYNGTIRSGDLHKVINGITGRTVYGKVIRVSHKFSGGSNPKLETEVRLLVPLI